MKWIRRCIVFIFPLLFLIISLVTLYDYGVNWDSLQQFARGQIYYQYLTTGKKYFTSTISYYEKTSLNFDWAQKMTIGHPPLTDILLAASNHLFYQKLGWTADIQGYHIYIVLVTFFMACIVAIWSYQLFGVFVSAISVIALYTYPLLFAEQHFNQKDPAVAAYFTACLYFLWLGITKKKVFPIVVSALFAGISLGTKFDILFAAPIVGIWLIFVFFQRVQKGRSWEFRKVFGQILTPWMTVALIGIPIIAFILFFVTYPALWSDPLAKVISVVNYYRDIGGSRCFYPPLAGKWFWECSDFHTVQLYATTLPLITVFLSVAGAVWALKRVGEHYLAPFLWFLWLLITLGRATVPIMSLYGGSLRQIMEFVPATALLTGAGVYAIVKHIRRAQALVYAGILLLYISVGVQMNHLHPNENLYYNMFVGGVSSAVRLGYTVPVNTYGNGYKQAIDWINKNIPYGSTVYLVEGITSAVPSIEFRSDIHYKGSAPILYTFDGSYLMELTEPGSDIRTYHNTKYVHAFLKPVYEKKVDGVPIVSVWKNDMEDATTLYDYAKEVRMIPHIEPVAGNDVVLDFGGVHRIKRLEMKTTNPGCAIAINSAYAFLSVDGIFYSRMLNVSSDFSLAATAYVSQGAYIFTGQPARFIRFYSFSNSYCDLSTVNYSVVTFP
jgi:hypothetical protein